MRGRRWLGLILVAVVPVLGQAANVFDGVDSFTADALHPGTTVPEDLWIVEIDRPTLLQMGEPWPWSRSRQAELVDALWDAGVATIAYDVLLAEESEDDGELRSALGRGPAVIASALTIGSERTLSALVADEAVLPADSFAGLTTAHANIALGSESGVVREVPAVVVRPDGRASVSFAIAASVLHRGIDPVATIRGGGVQFGADLVPTENGRMRINFAEGMDAKRISAAEVLDGSRLPTPGALVLVGVTEATLGDLHLIPIDKSGDVPGVVVQAHAASTVMQRAYLSEVGLGTAVTLIVVLTALSMLLVRFLAVRFSLPALALLVVAYGLWVIWRFDNGDIVPIASPTFTIVLTGAAGLILRYVTETRQHQRVRNLFAQYVPGDALESLEASDRIEETIAGQRVRAAVLFCDLRGFTTTAAALRPQDVRRLLDHYYAYASDIVDRHGGAVIQFVGDEVFALFGVPVVLEDPSTSALDAACELADSVGDLAVRLDDDGLPPVAYGIGVAAGEVLTAHVGTSRHRQFAAIGDVVILGSRLCGEARAGEVAISEELLSRRTAADTRGFVAESLTMKGIEGPFAGARRPPRR